MWSSRQGFYHPTECHLWKKENKSYNTENKSKDGVHFLILHTALVKPDGLTRCDREHIDLGFEPEPWNSE
jgi:hypothetical protein